MRWLFTLLLIAAATSSLASPMAQVNGGLISDPTVSENFQEFPDYTFFSNPVTVGGLTFLTPNNSGFFIYPGNGRLGFDTGSLYQGGINTMLRVQLANHGQFEAIKFGLGNGTGSDDPNYYFWIRTYLDGLPTGFDFDFAAPNGSTFLVSGGGFDELRVQSYWKAADLALHDESTFGAVAIDNITATQVPEPATFGLLGIGLLGLVASRRKPFPAQ